MKYNQINSRKCVNLFVRIHIYSFFSQSAQTHIKRTYEKHVYQAMMDEYVISFSIHGQPFQLHQGKTSRIPKTFLFSSFHASGTYVHTKQLHTRSKKECWYFQPFHLTFQYWVSKEDGETNVTRITTENHVTDSAVWQRTAHITDQLIISTCFKANDRKHDLCKQF